jgi:hypothetical protein
MHRTRWTGEVQNKVDLCVIGIHNVVPYELEVRMRKEVTYVIFIPGMKIIQTDHVPSHANISIAQVATQETCTTCDEYPWSSCARHDFLRDYECVNAG